MSDACQPVANAILSRCGASVRNVLHGSPLGHPLHAILTDLPIGAWVTTAVLDVLESRGASGLAAGADGALVVGLLGAAGAGVTGWADWSDTKDDVRSLGMAHAALNSCAILAYLGAYGLRRSRRRGPGIAMAMVGLGFVVTAAFLGGELSFGMQLGVKHTAEPLLPDAAFVPVLPLAALEDGVAKRVDHQGAPVLIRRCGDAVQAMSAICTHRGAPLEEGELSGECVRCPWHGSLFRFADGGVAAGPATFPVARYESRINAGMVEIRPFRKLTIRAVQAWREFIEPFLKPEGLQSAYA